MAFDLSSFFFEAGVKIVSSLILAFLNAHNRLPPAVRTKSKGKS
jgi:hypothetical protein